MDKAMREKFKDILLKLRGNLQNDIKHMDFKSPKDSSGDLSNWAVHMADQGTDSFDRDMNLELHGTEQEIMRQVDEALTKIKDATYGRCEACQKDIPLKRLKVIPYARFCISCQDKLEGEKKTP